MWIQSLECQVASDFEVINNLFPSVRSSHYETLNKSTSSSYQANRFLSNSLFFGVFKIVHSTEVWAMEKYFTKINPLHSGSVFVWCSQKSKTHTEIATMCVGVYWLSETSKKRIEIYSILADYMSHEIILRCFCDSHICCITFESY